MSEWVTLVDTTDLEIGQAEKLHAHEQCLLHRAFSIVITNDKGEVLLQQRAASKYHSANLWTNACCGHPRPGEKTLDAANRRLKEELNFSTPLQFKFSFTYQCAFANGLFENEYDHVFAGQYNKPFSPNPDEVSAYKYVPWDELLHDVQSSPQLYTEWFKILIPAYLNQQSND